MSGINTNRRRFNASPSPLWGGVGVGGGSAFRAVSVLPQLPQRVHHGSHGRFPGSENVDVGNPEHAKSTARGIGILRAILLSNFRQIVDATIDFDEKAFVELAEIPSVRTHRSLSAEMTSFDFSEKLPEPLLRRRHVSAQASGARIGVREISLAIRHLRRPPPHPLPTRGRGRSLRPPETYASARVRCKIGVAA
jgi:hypothetical protein